MTHQIFEGSTNLLPAWRDQRQALQDEMGNPKAERAKTAIIEI